MGCFWFGEEGDEEEEEVEGEEEEEEVEDPDVDEEWTEFRPT